jgi:hypothetical protein
MGGRRKDRPQPDVNVERWRPGEHGGSAALAPWLCATAFRRLCSEQRDRSRLRFHRVERRRADRSEISADLRESFRIGTRQWASTPHFPRNLVARTPHSRPSPGAAAIAVRAAPSEPRGCRAPSDRADPRHCSCEKPSLHEDLLRADWCLPPPRLRCRIPSCRPAFRGIQLHDRAGFSVRIARSSPLPFGCRRRLTRGTAAPRPAPAEPPQPPVTRIPCS